MSPLLSGDVEQLSVESRNLLEKVDQDDDDDAWSVSVLKRDGAMKTARMMTQRLLVLTASLPLRFLSALKPALLLDTLSNAKPKKRGATAWMDGMRGFASMCVYSQHYTNWSHGAIHLGWAVYRHWGWEGRHYFILSPGIRLFFTGGKWGVTVFYVLAGYVLSASALNAIHAGNIEGLANRMISSLFRRWLRLFIPLFVTSFIWITSWHVLGIQHVDIEPEPTYYAEVKRWAGDTFDLADIFTETTHSRINDHTWSVAVSFRGSIVVFTSCLAFARLKTHYRLLGHSILIFYFWYCVSSEDASWNAMFCAGMLFCDVQMLLDAGELPKPLARMLPKSRQPIHYLLIIIGLLTSSVLAFLAYREVDMYDNMPLRTLFLQWVEPRGRTSVKWFWEFWSVICFLIAIPRIPWMKAALESSIPQYLGKISYCLYLIHGPIMWAFSDRVFAMFGVPRYGDERRDALVQGWIDLFPLPTWGIAGLELNYVVSQIIVLSFTIWLADLATRYIDEPSVNFGYWLMKKGRRQ